MSLQATIEASCPACTDGFDAPIWSFVNGETDAGLRDQAKAGECNLLLCPSCGAAFVPEASWVYYEPKAEIVAFVMPEAWKAEEDRWRKHAAEDFARMRGALEGALPADVEPEVFFGPLGLSELLEKEDWRIDERDVMAHFAKDLGLGIFRASPRWARANGAPAEIPFVGGQPTRDSFIKGIRTLLAANDRLTTWSTFLSRLESDGDARVPPAAQRR
jgi:hypothetical protein